MEKFTDYPSMELADIERFIDDLATENQRAIDSQQGFFLSLQELLCQIGTARRESLFG